MSRNRRPSPAPESEEIREARGNPVTPLFHSTPAWDITDEEISEWQHSRAGLPGIVLAGYTAAAIRDGRFEGSWQLFSPDSGAYREVTRKTVEQAMGMLMERGMVRKSAGSWYPVTPTPGTLFSQSPVRVSTAPHARPGNPAA
jgi:hypothetical protein